MEVVDLMYETMVNIDSTVSVQKNGRNFICHTMTPLINWPHYRMIRGVSALKAGRDRGNVQLPLKNSVGFGLAIPP
ncbi:hypothetical protein GCM10009414_04310 [Tatumella terrea]